MSRQILSTPSACTTLLLKQNTLILCLFLLCGKLHNGLPWIFAELFKLVPYFGLWMACPSMPCSLSGVAMFEMVVTLLDLSFPHGIITKDLLNLLGGLCFDKKWCNICVWSCRMKIWRVRTTCLYSRHNNWGTDVAYQCKIFSRMCKKASFISHPKDFTHAALVLVGKIDTFWTHLVNIHCPACRRYFKKPNFHWCF